MMTSIIIVFAIYYLWQRSKKKKALQQMEKEIFGDKPTELNIPDDDEIIVDSAQQFKQSFYESFCGIGVDKTMDLLAKVNIKEARLLAFMIEITAYNLNQFGLTEEEKENYIHKTCKDLIFFCNKEGIEHYVSAKEGFVVYQGDYFVVNTEFPYPVGEKQGILLKSKEMDNFQFGACLNEVENLEKVLKKFFKDNNIDYGV